MRRAIAIGCKAWGLDIRAEVVRSAYTRSGSDRFVVGTATRLPFQAQSIDLVVAQHVVEHLPDPVPAIMAWRRVLRPSGKLALVTPNLKYPDPTIYEDPDHVRIYDARNLAALLRKAGMDLLRIKTIFPHMRGHIVFGLRHYRFFSSIPPWSARGRSLLCIAGKA